MTAKKWLNYHHLYYFKVIATEGGIAKAAEKLRLGQPTLSTQLKQFEDVLGVSLFDRAKRHLSLTEAGSLVLAYANDIFKLGTELLDTLSDNHDSPKLRVQIGVTSTVPRQIAAKVFEFASGYKNSFVSMVYGEADELLRQLRVHQLDVVLSNISPRTSDAKGFYSKHIVKMPIIVCGSKNFSDLKKGFPQSLTGKPFIMPGPTTKLKQDIEHFFRLREISVDVIAEIQDTGLQKILATGSYGLIAIDEPAAEEIIKAKDLFEIGRLEDVSEDLWLIAAERKIQNPIAKAMMQTSAIFS